MDALSLLWAIGLTLGSWILLGSLCAGVGLLTLGTFGGKRVDAEELLPAFWTGLCLFIGFLQLYNFARPIDWIPMAGLGSIGVAGLWIHGRVALGNLCLAAKAYPIPSTALALALVFLADRAIASPGNCYDTGLYHASVVRWAVTSPVVPGLANLHFRLGFNNSIHLFGAAVTAGPWGRLAPHVVNGLIFAALTVQAAIALTRLILLPQRSDVAKSIMDALVFPPFVLMACQYEVTGFSSDGVAAAMTAVAASRIVGMTLSANGDRRLRPEFFFVSLLLSTAVTIKLSTAPFGAAAWGLAALLTLRHERPQTARAMFRLLAVPALAAAALIAPWMVRGVILSGYPMFPSKLLAMPVTWRVPSETADALSAVILSSARHQEDVAGGWLIPWAKWAFLGQPFWITVPLILIAAAAIFFAYVHRRPPMRLWLIAPCLLGIAAWFLIAPDPRFAFVLFWIVAATLVGATTVMRPFRQRVLRHTVAAATFGLAIAAVVQRPPFVGPGPDHGFHPMPKPDVEAAFTESGLKVYIPVFEDKCWDAPLPCAPFVTPGLKLRVAENLTSGFIVERSTSGPAIR